MSVIRRLRLDKLLVAATAISSLATFISITQAQPGVAESSPVKSTRPAFVAEPGCPIELTTRPRAEFELDETGMPLAARQYLEFRNVSEKAITSIKFRFGFVDDAGMMSVFQGTDRRKLNPGTNTTQKWRTEVGPNTRAIKIRVMEVVFDDGSSWESSKSSVSSSQDPNPQPQLPPPTVRPTERTETAETDSKRERAHHRHPDQPRHSQPASTRASEGPGNIGNPEPTNTAPATESSADVEMLPPPAPVPEEPFPI